MIILNILAYITIVVTVLSVIIAPVMIGKTRPDYSIANVYGEFIWALIVIPLALHALGAF